MSREKRRIDVGVTYHLISRLVDRQWFIKTEDERAHYRGLLGRSLTGSDWRCLAFAIMSNHIHIAAIAGAQPLDAWIRRVHAPFATAMNRSYDRIGQMFVRGPKSIPVDDSRIGDVIAYIHNNPVRAGVVTEAARSDWTSHLAYVGRAPCPPWLHVAEGLQRSGFSSTRALEFDDWVRDPEREQFDRIYERVTKEKPKPMRVRAPIVSPATIVALVASELGLSVERIRSPRKSAVEVVAREAAAYCASECGLLGAEISRALGITQQAVSHMLRRSKAAGVKPLVERVMMRIRLLGPEAH